KPGNDKNRGSHSSLFNKRSARSTGFGRFFFLHDLNINGKSQNIPKNTECPGSLFYDYNFYYCLSEKYCCPWNNFLKVIKITTLCFMNMLGLHHIDRLIIELIRQIKNV